MTRGTSGTSEANGTSAGARHLVRRTVSRPSRRSGVTLFTGAQAAVLVRPGPAGSGVTLVVGGGGARIAASAGAVVRESRRTVLAADVGDPKSPRVQTVEHLMSALAGLGGMGTMDVEVEVEGPELPIGDGSALIFVEMLAEAGVVETAAAAANVAVVREPVEVRDGEAWVRAEPCAPGRTGILELEYRLEYGAASGSIPAQSARIEMPVGGPAPAYAREVAPARTFCLAEEALAMRKMGLFAHLSAKEMLVIGPDGPVENTYRFENECARHKLLDLLGDLSLCGRAVEGRVVAHRAGHALNHEMARKLAAM